MLESRYADVIRCLRTAAKTQPIVEAESLQDALLAVAAPALARVQNGTQSLNLNAIAKSMVGDVSKMFDLTAVKGKLHIALKSQILEVPGFPLEIAKDDDVVKVVSKALKLEKSHTADKEVGESDDAIAS